MTPQPRCTCGAPVTLTVRRVYPWGAGPVEHVCATCAPAPATCDLFQPFSLAGQLADEERSRAIALTEGRRAA